MTSFTVDPVVEYANKKYKNLGCVVDVYTFQVLWVDEEHHKKLGYTPGEMYGMNIRKLLDLSSKGFMQVAISKYKGEPNKKTLFTKSGEKIASTGEINTFLYKGSPYIAISNVVIG